MAEVSCPLPGPPTTHAAARAVFAQVRKEMKGLTPAAQRRESARRMGLDYETYLAAWKKPAGDAVIPKPSPVGPSPADRMKKAYDAGWLASKNTRTFDLESAEYRYERKHGRDDRAMFAAGWTDYAVDAQKYTSFKVKQ